MIGKAVALLSATSLAAALQIAPGNRAYRSGELGRALEGYRRAVERGPENPVARYNLGTALLRAARAPEAAPHLASAVEASNPELRARAWYNLGNVHLGRALAGDADARARAVEAYRRTLLLRPDDLDAKWNLELALRQGEPPPTPTSASGAEGGEGHEDDPQRSGGGGEPRGGAESETGGAAPQPAAAPDRRPLSRSAAEQILNAVEEQERALQGETLRRLRPSGRPVGPDW